MRGYFGIGIYHGKTKENIGTLWRTAYNLGASFVFTIGKRYEKECSDTPNSYKKIPLYNYEDYEDFYKHIPMGCRVVAVELTDDAVDLAGYEHPEQCVYLLGAEDHGIPDTILSKCHAKVKINTNLCMNVAVTGGIVMYDRKTQCA